MPSTPIEMEIPFCKQVTQVEESGGLVTLKMAEMLVGSINLKFVDKESGEARAEGATRPEVVMRQLCTRPGQVCPSPLVPLLH